jgi:SSS family transporter
MSSSNESIPAPLSQGWGYGVTVGFGLAFAIGMMGITEALKRSTGENNRHFETFAVAGRKIGTGLTATAVISSWAWSTALLSSSAITYNYGAGGAYWFAAGCLVQICFFALIAIQSKRRTPHAHTVLEVVRARYGKIAHLVYMVLCLATNIIAYVNMSLGASAAISALTGMNTVAAIFLLPVGVCLYTITGGLRATFITDYLHTVALLIICIYLILKTLTSPAIGSLDNLYRLVQQAGVISPVKGNYNGSYLTMSSQNAIAFGTLHTLGNFGLVLLDSSYWQKAFSADVTAAAPGYILGGTLYFGIPWALGTVAGCAGLALQYSQSPYWPVHGRALSQAENNNGLVLPYVGLATTGSAGAAAVVIVIFMACTSTISAQIVAVSSIVSSDIFHTYLKPNASERAIINVSRAACVGFALVGSAVSVALYYAGLSLTWTLYFLGVITTPGMVTISLTVLWNRQTKAAAIISPIVGLACGLAVWLATSAHYGNGVLDVTTTGELIPCMWGNIASAFVPMILSPLISLTFPDNQPFSWERFNAIKLISDSDSAQSALEKDVDTFTPEQLTYMARMSKVAGILGAVFFLGLWVIWPFGMYGAYYEFSLPFFRGWVVVSIIWIFAALLIVTFMPPIEGRRSIYYTVIGQKQRLTNAKAHEIRGAAPADGEEHATPDSPRSNDVESGEQTPANGISGEKKN